MKKSEFLKELRKKLKEINYSNIDEVIHKYDKLIDETKNTTGKQEEEVISNLGLISDIVTYLSSQKAHINSNEIKDESSLKKNTILKIISILSFIILFICLVVITIEFGFLGIGYMVYSFSQFKLNSMNALFQLGFSIIYIGITLLFGLIVTNGTRGIIKSIRMKCSIFSKDNKNIFLTKIKGFLITSGILVIMGIGLMGISGAQNSFNYNEILMNYAVLEEQVISESITSIEYTGSIDSVYVYLAEAEEIKLIGYKGNKINYHTSVEDNKLVINQELNYNWYDSLFQMGGNEFEEKLVLYLYIPITQIESLNINLTKGNIKFEEIEIKSTEITLNSGNLDIVDSKFENFSVDVTSGRVDVSNGVCNLLQMKTLSGSIYYDGDILENGKIEVEKGNINLSLLRDVSNYTVNGFGHGTIEIILEVKRGKTEITYKS